MALSDDISNLPNAPASGSTSHLTNHAVIHAALKAHDTDLTKKADLVGGRVAPAQLIGSGASGSGIRVDDSVGTRVFVGNVMVHGDTGWRDVSSIKMEGWEGQIWLRRSGSRVTILLMDLERTTSGASNMAYLPSGFRSPIFGVSGFNYGSPYPLANAETPTALLGGHMYVAGGGSIARVSFEPEVTSVQGDASWDTNDNWPSSLPGTPI